MTRTADSLPDFKRQMDVAGKLDSVDPTVAKLITTSGLSDGDSSDDKVSVSRGSWPAASLKPSQTSMVLPKALGMALFMLKKGKVGGDLGALVSKDGHILDGHHRWAATILASGSKGKVGGYGANLPGKDLLRVLNVVSKGLFNVRNGKAGKGSLAQFTEGNVRSMLEDFAENGIGGEFPWSPQDVQSTLEQNFGSVEAGIDAMAKNASLITTSVPGWAPDRKQMPVIEPEQVPSAAKALTRGEVDWNDPHRKEGSKTLTASDRKRLIRLASSMPKGSPERRAILAGLTKAAAGLTKAAGRKTLSDLLNAATAHYLSEAAKYIERNAPRELGLKVKFNDFIGGSIKVEGSDRKMECGFRGGEYLMLTCKGQGPGFRFDEELQAAGYDGATMAERKLLPLIVSGEW
jgi:hypothetical protein